MKVYYRNAVDSPLVDWDSVILHEELKAGLSPEDYALVQISDTYIRVPDTGETIVLTHGSQEAVDARNIKYQKDIIDAELSLTDPRMDRIVEDLISLLISKSIIQESELPQSAQDHINERINLRLQRDQLG